METIAFIGLGNMGAPMALNLLKADFNVRVFDLVDDAMKLLQHQGATVASSAVEAVAGVDVIISMLPAGKHVKQLYLGDETTASLLDTLAPGTLIIDSSTIDADSARSVAQAAAENQQLFIDAPVSGGTAGAKAGTLTFICGGTEASFNKAKPILEVMGQNIFHAGEAGAGQVAKICNNMLLSILMIGTSEAINLGIDNGLDPKILSDIMKVSSGGNWTLEKYNPCPKVMPDVPSSHQYQGGFMTDLMQKDLGLSQQTALLSRSSTPMGALANSMYITHSRQGNGKKDFSSIFNHFKKK